MCVLQINSYLEGLQMNLDNGKRILKLYDYEFRATADLPNPDYKKERYIHEIYYRKKNL